MLLPQPLWPTIARNSPSRTSRSTPCSTGIPTGALAVALEQPVARKLDRRRARRHGAARTGTTAGTPARSTGPPVAQSPPACGRRRSTCRRRGRRRTPRIHAPRRNPWRSHRRRWLDKLCHTALTLTANSKQKDFARSPRRPHSYRNARTGCSRAARRAGSTLASTAMPTAPAGDPRDGPRLDRSSESRSK